MSFESAAQTLTLVSDERALRSAYDRARMLLESLGSSGSAEPELLDAADRLLRSYRHHIERCDIETWASPVVESRNGS